MTWIDEIDWGATGSMIGGVGAWAQLCAAIVAVIVAYRLGRLQVVAVDRSALNDRNRRRRAVLGLGELVVEAMVAQAKVFETDKTMRDAALSSDTPSLFIPDLLKRMKALPTVEIEDRDALDSFIRLSAAARQFMISVRNLQNPNMQEPFRTLVRGSMLSAVDAAQHELGRLQASLANG